MSSNMLKQLNIIDSEILGLIEEVKNHECLWNREEHPLNKGDKRLQMAQAWKEISENLGIQIDYCRTKWRHLRDMFRREIRRNSISTLEEYAGTWKFFRPLWFLYRPGTEDVHDDNPIQYVKHEPVIETYYAEEDPMEESRSRKRKRDSDNDSDSDVLFLKSLAPYLRQLDPVRKLVVRNKIQNVLISELSTNLGENSS